MKKISLYVSVLLIVLSLSGCGQKNVTPVDDNTSNLEKFNKIVLDLTKKGEPFHCTYNLVTAFGIIDAEIFVEGTKTRSDIKTNIKTKSQSETIPGAVESHIINTDNEVFSWSGNIGARVKKTAELQAKAEKSSIAEFSEALTGPNSGTTVTDFKCNEWIVDDAVFQAPTNIQFEDATENLNKVLNK